MNSMKSFVSLAVLCAVIATCSGAFSISKSGEVEADEKCATHPNKEVCTLELCEAESPGLFECQALRCKVDKQGISKQAILDCVKEKCTSSSHAVCTGISECDAVNVGTTGQAKYIICITKLFPRNS